MSTVDAHDATTTYYCHAPGCDAEAPSRVGRYAYCERHRSTTNGGQRTQKKMSGTAAAQLQGLMKLARERDSLAEKAKRLTEKALAAKATADAKDDAYRAALREATDDDRPQL